MAEANFDVFKGRDFGFVAESKTKGLQKLCLVLNILNCTYNVNNNSMQYRRRLIGLIRFIQVNEVDRPGLFMNILKHLLRLICRCMNNGMNVLHDKTP